MEGMGVALTPSYYVRMRSASDSTSYRSTAHQPLKTDSSSSRASGNMVVSPSAPSQDAANQDTAIQETSQDTLGHVEPVDSSEGIILLHSSDSARVTEPENTLTVQKVQDSEGDFTRNIRGASAPNDISPSVTPSQSHSLPTNSEDMLQQEGRAEEGVTTSEQDEGGSHMHSDAIESEENKEELASL